MPEPAGNTGILPPPPAFPRNPRPVRRPVFWRHDQAAEYNARDTGLDSESLRMARAWHRSRINWTVLSLLAACVLAEVPRAAEPSAVILVYHRFGESEHPSTSIRLDQFEAHLRELASGDYTVLPVPEIVARVRNGEALPERTVGLTIDDAFLSVYREAWPRLRDAGFPFTLFVATDPVDYNRASSMSWDQLRELHRAGVTIGSQTRTHPHMTQITREDAARELEESNARFLAELGEQPRLFAYPFGEYDLDVRDLVRRHGFEVAFGQHSGVVHAGTDRLALPRFPLNERYGGLDRFRLVINALPLPVTDVLPANPVIAQNPPPFGFTVPDRLGHLDRLACFASSGGGLDLEVLGRRVEARFHTLLPPGRSRVNCTMPGPDARWRWFGVQFLSPES